MAQRCESEEAPEVALHQGEARSVKNADDGESDQQGRNCAGLGREQPDMKAQHGVDAQLASNHHGHCHGRFTEGVGEPSMKREHRNLDGERKQKRQCHPEERSSRQCTGADQYAKLAEVERSRSCIEP